MGQTLQRAAQWTDARDKGAGGKLEFTPLNEEILNLIVEFVESQPSRNPAEAKLEFKKPLEWTTAALDTNSNFAGSFEKTDKAVESAEKHSKSGESLLCLKKEGSRCSISVQSLEFAAKALQAAGGKKVNELRACLEANRDPVVCVLGEAYATVEGEDLVAYRLMEQIIKSEQAKSENDGADGEVSRQTLRLFTSIQQLDMRLLNLSLKKVSASIRVTPSSIDAEMKLIQSLCGSDENTCLLKAIKYTRKHASPSGCRAPPWRQLCGEICYIVADPFDGDKLTITAHTAGVFLNQGILQDGDEQYDRDGEYCKDLLTLLKEKSDRFAENLSNQDFKAKLSQMEEEQTMYHDGEHENAKEEGNEKKGKGKSDHAAKGKGGDAKKVEKENSKDSKKPAKEEEKKSKKLEPTLQTLPASHSPTGGSPTQHRRSVAKRTSPNRMRHSTAHDYTDDESESESEDEEEVIDRRTDMAADLPSEYWQIQKLVKYLKAGNQTATVIALCSLRDFNLSQETCQLAIRDVGGLEILINLLETEEVKCKIGALKILREISRNAYIRRSIADLGGLQVMVDILSDRDRDLKCLSAETIANVAKFKRARKVVAQNGGIEKLVQLLSSDDSEVARCGASALWSCSKSKRNKNIMRSAGVIPLLAKLLAQGAPKTLVPVVGTLQECASQPSYRKAIRTENMIQELVKHMKSSDEELQMHCASAIFKCAQDKDTRDLVRIHGGLDPMVALLNRRENKDLLAAATGAIWKCSISPENVKRFQELKAIQSLVALLSDQPEQVLINVVGAVAECAQDAANREAIRKANGIPPLVSLLTSTNQTLLVNVCKAVGKCAQDSDNMGIIDRLDGVRLLWSLLKNPNPEVQAAAAWAICPCIESAREAGELVRSFVGGLELIVSLLKSENREVLASVCSAIANIAKDEENLAVITDHGVVASLADLTKESDELLRTHLAEAVSRCCMWGHNREAFGRYGAVAPLVRYLNTKDTALQRTTARALHQLSKHPQNCIVMHEEGVVKPLLQLVGSGDEDLQEASANCLSNIRRLALANQKARKE